ncbi:MAG: hypothetical protein RBT33_03500 [Candidatus Dojkabacteria bacterium]|jgi:hypothetical protein|nr:hypothetical protein [Candidatus Dojkabacteria bacterium]
MSVTASQYLKNSNSKKSFTGVFHYTTPVRSKHDSVVEIYGLLSVNSEVDIPGANIAKFAWDGIVDGFEYSKSESTNEALKIALTESTRRIKQLIVNDKNISSHGVNINFSVFVSCSKGLYVGCLGDCDIYIYKKDRLVDIHEMLSKKNAKTAGLVIESEDILFSSTEGFLKRNIEKLTGLSNKKDMLEALDGIANNLEESEGILILTEDAPELKEEEEILEKKVVESNLDSDYIPTQKENIVKKDTKERDLKSFLTTFKSRSSLLLKPIYIKLKSILLSLKDSLKRIKIKNPFSNIIFKIKEGLKNKRWFKRISAKVSQSDISSSKRAQFKGFKVDGYKIKNKKIERFKIAFFLFLGIVVVVGGVKFTLDQKEARRISNEANAVFSSVEGFLKDAEEKSRTDRVGSETLVFRAADELKKVPEGLGEKDSAKFEALESRVLTLQDELYKRIGLVDSDGSIETYIETRLAFGEGSTPTDVAMYSDSKGNEYLLVTDSSLKGVFGISLYDKEVKRLSDSNSVLQEPAMLYIGKSGLFVLDTRVGVVKAEFDDNGWFKPFVKLTGLGIENIGAKDIAEFAVLTETDNVYILDRGEKALLKSSNFGSGYGLSFAYIKDDSFTEANDILADLSVYILTSGANGLHRYIYSYFESKMIASPLEILGLDGEIKNLTYGYTRGELSFDLYLFDKEDRRIMRFEKPIEGGGEVRHPNQALLKSQYLYRGNREDVWSKVKDLVVTKDQKTLYILDSSIIWKVRL